MEEMSYDLEVSRGQRCPSCGNPAINQGDCCSCLKCGCVFSENPKTKPTDPILVCVCGENVALENYGVNWTQWQGTCKCGMPWHVEEIDEAALEGDDEDDDDDDVGHANPCGSRWRGKNPSEYRRYRQRPPEHFAYEAPGKKRMRTVPVRHSDAPSRFKKIRGAKAVVGKLKPKYKIPGPRGGRTWTTQSVLVPKKRKK